MKYENFLKIDPRFYSVFNKEVDESNPDLWKTFIPHRGFIEFLDRTLKSLSRERPQDTKSIWLYGSYGTGKTHAGFVLKHLLEDEENVINEYLNRFRQILYPYIEKINSLRRDGILVIYKSGAGHINSSIKLNLEIQQAIYESYKKLLNKKGCIYSLKNTDLDFLKYKVKDEIINWDYFLEKYKRKLFYVSSKEEIISKIERGEIDFCSNLIDCLREEGIQVSCGVNVEALKTWIEELLADGQVSKILFIWDEFSDFFKYDAPIFTFQELIHLTSKVPFYFLIVTHRPPDFWSERLSEDIRKIKDRLLNIYYTMENVTIYKLINYMLQSKDEKVWKDFKEEIFSKIEQQIKSGINKLIEQDENLRLEDIEKVFPLHPYSIYLMGKVVEYYGSTNRSLFEFLKSEKGFLKFLREYPKNGYYFLTPDFLWDFFFAESEEVTTFYPKVKKWLNYFSRNIEKLENEEEKRIFKTICLLFTLKEEVLITKNEENLIIKPTFSTLKIAFSGTEIYKNLLSILNELDNKKVIKLHKSIYEIEILEPTDDIDLEEFEKIKKNLSDFSEFIREMQLQSHFNIHRRLVLKIITDEDVLNNRIPSVSCEPYQIFGYLIIMKDGKSIITLEEKIKNLAQKKHNTLFLTSYFEFGDEKWEKLREELAYQKYYENLKDYKQSTYHKNNILENLNEFVNRVKKDKFSIIFYSNDLLLSEICYGLDKVMEWFKREILYGIFPYSLEYKITSEPLWSKTSLNKKAISYALEPQKSDRAFSSLINELIVNNFLDFNKNPVENSFERKIEHPLIKIKELIEEFLTNSGEIPIKEIWEKLKRPPFGFYKAPLCIFCFTFVLRRYASGFYAINQEGYEVELNQDKLKAIIEETLLKDKQEWLIRPLSKEQLIFCNFINEIFSLKTKTPREGIILLRDTVKREIKYPLWIFKYSSLETISEAKIILTLLHQIITSSIDEKFKNLTNYFRELSSYLDSLPPIEKNRLYSEIRILIKHSKQCFQEFVRKYLNEFENKEIDLTLLEDKIRERLQEEPWYWEEESLKELLDLIKKELIVVRKIGEALKTEKIIFIEELVSRIKDFIRTGKISPYWMYEKYLYNENLRLIKSLFNFDLSFKDIKDENLINNLILNLDTICEIFQKLLTEREMVILNWIREKFEIFENDLLNKELIQAFNNLIFEFPEISEVEAFKRLKESYTDIKLNIIKTEVKSLLNQYLGTYNIQKFLEDKKFPIVLIKYLPKFSNFYISENPDIFFYDLLRVDELPENRLEKIKEVIHKAHEILINLNREESLKESLKNFIDLHFDKNILDEIFFEDFYQYYQKSSISINSVENEIKELLNRWFNERYLLIYKELEEKLMHSDYDELKALIFELIKKPEIGLLVLKVIRKRTF